MEKIINFFNIYKKYVIGIILIVILLVSILLSNNKEKENKVLNITSENVEPLKKDAFKADSDKEIFIDIKGHVNSPGVYKMTENERVVDAIEKAGGLIEDASTMSINLSKKVYDQMVIIIYSKKETANYNDTINQTHQIIVECNEKDYGVLNNSCIDEFSENESDVSEFSENSIKQLISINTATLEELQTLTGIGEKKAIEIINYRKTNKFVKIEDIMNVPGIGESVFAQIKNYITI